MRVNSFPQLTSRVVSRLTVFILTLTGVGLASTPVSAATTNVSVYITNVTANVDPTSGLQIVQVRGELLNRDETTIDEIQVVLGTRGRFTNRESLHNFLANREEAKLTESKIAAKLANIRTNQKRSWQITFVAQDVVRNANGIYGLGVQAKRNELLGADVFALPILDSTNTPNLKTIFAVQLTTLNSHLASGGSSTTDSAELDRLINLIKNAVDAPVSWIVDPVLRQWIAELQETELSEKATELLELLNLIAPKSTPTIYSQPDLATLLASNRGDDLTNLVVRTNQFSGTDKIVIAPKSGQTSNAAITKLVELGVQPILTNEFVADSQYKSISAKVSLAEGPALINDVALDSCLNTKQQDLVTKFRELNCLQSDLAFVATSGVQSALLLTPLDWNPGPDATANLAIGLSSKSWVSVAPLNELIDSAPTENLKMPKDIEVDSFSIDLIEQGDAISTSSVKISSIFSDPNYSDAFSLARLRGFSALWPTGDLATEFLKSNEQLLASYQDAISIDTSRTITVSNTSSEIPITVVNSSDRDIAIVVVLTSPISSRFSSNPSSVVTIESGKRVTIPMDITLSGKGIINVTATIFAPNGQSIGKAKLIQISSAEYQGFARTLVLVAFGLLVLLSISNIVRRRREVNI